MTTRATMAPLLVAVLVLFTAQQLLFPLLAPLSRELALSETQLGVVIAVAAVMFTVASPLWGRLIDRWACAPPASSGSGWPRSA